MVPTADFHNSEYVDRYFKMREYLSGFTGSNGTLVVSQKEAGLWTDGRYFIQAENELSGTGIRLFRMLEDGDLDALLSFRVSHPPKGDILYRETGKAPLVCLLPRRHPMARESSLDLRRLRGERLVLLTPAKPQPEALHTLLGRTVGERTPAELYFCESTEAVAALVGAEIRKRL